MMHDNITPCWSLNNINSFVIYKIKKPYISNSTLTDDEVFLLLGFTFFRPLLLPCLSCNFSVGVGGVLSIALGLFEVFMKLSKKF